MSQVVPDTLEREVLDDIFSENMTLRLFGNNVTPDSDSQTADFNEISGGGYVSNPLLSANWLEVNGNPSYNVYNSTQEWVFTDPIDAPGSIYGYYVTRDVDNKLMWAERFPSAVVPFSPINGSIIKVLPKFTCQSAF
jgi:hypothetical protein